jgi:hypothetical protein
MGDETGTKDEIGYETREAFTHNFNKQGMCYIHYMTLPFTLKKKIYENPNIFHHAKFRIFKNKTKPSKRNQKSFKILL